MMRKTLLAAALMTTALTAHADYKCEVTPRDDVILSPQTVQEKGENGNLVITPGWQCHVQRQAVHAERSPT